MKAIKDVPEARTSHMRGFFRPHENIFWLCVLFFLSTKLNLELLKIIMVFYVEFVVTNSAFEHILSSSWIPKYRNS